MQEAVSKILQIELARRCSSNPKYSLRAFARALGISAANLSLLIAGKREPSSRTISRILERLSLSGKQRLQLRQRLGLEILLPADTLDLETVERISSWPAYAILSLTVCKEFESDYRWIARRLAISAHEVRATVNALVDAKLLSVGELPWRATREVRINNQVSTQTVREFHKQLLAKAIESMENLPMDSRDISSITFAMSPEKMSAAKEEIRKFRLRMSEVFEEPGKSTEVYNLTIQLVPTTRR